MPNAKHGKGHRHVHEDAHNNNLPNNGHHAVNNRDRVEHQNHQDNENGGPRFQQCCVPLGCSDDPIDPSDPYDAVRVVCNNDMCTLGKWMHKDCFIEWEQSVLSFLRSCGRARSWSEKQRLQNLWTKKGYDLAYKACDCKCGRGHLRKDLDYIPPPLNDNHKKARKNKKKNDKPMPVVSTNHKSGLNSNGGVNNHHPTQNAHQVDNYQHHVAPANHSENRKKETPAPPTGSTNKRRGSDNSVNNNIPSTSTATVATTGGQGQQVSSSKTRSRTNNVNHTESEPLDNRAQVSNHNLHQSNSNHSGQQAPPPPQTPHTAVIAVAYGLPAGGSALTQRMRTNSMSSTGSVCSQTSSNGSLPSSAGSSSPLSSSPSNANVFFAKATTKPGTDQQLANYPAQESEPSCHQQPGNGQTNGVSVFRRRQDLSAFSALPRCKQNPYNIHMEETGLDEDEDTRNFVLNSLSTKRMTGLRCVLCKLQLPVFDRFPLLDGTLFLSPQAYDPTVVQVIWEGRIQFLNAVCLGCLQGDGGCQARCSSCHSAWDGRSLVVGTMYTYDVFAATPCCQKRLTCKHCRRAVVDVTRGLPYYSQYSRMILCPFCKANDYHFIRPLPETFTLLDVNGSICESH
ncbi:headcase protein-like [Elysia marginata]|uniref:Headcase protein-like n=1 Tax=Elysia marginata TaxID=1093978 RepID=A0AAV4IRG7_9GAST|nr:headcase protein-like [Elysia marginata]